ncbi:MAG: DUF4388 domain-containing protein [Deltaproteobacteria bacterium]|nr:DUF4388 domain-containing protein [Deltaproteobacteria bacterium]
MEIQGLLQDVSVSALLLQAESEEQTGVLYLKGEGMIGEVAFENGRIYAAASPFVRERIGQRLILEGVIRPADLYQALQDQENHPKHALGELLVERGLLPPERLQEFLTFQIEEAVLHLAMWQKGRFTFERRSRRKKHPVGLCPGKILEQKERMMKLKEELPRGVMEWVEKSPDSCLFHRFQSDMERTFSRAERFEPRIIILLVEGDSRMRMMVHDELVKHNFSIKGAGNVTKARAQIDHLLEQGYSPIVVTDVDFPHRKKEMQLEGLSFMETLHQEHPEIPILVSTSYPISNLRRKILFSGGIFCLVKPDLDVLSSRNFEQVFQAYIRELGYCLDLSIQQYYQQYYRERAEILRDDLMENLMNARAEINRLGSHSIEETKIHDLYYRVSDLLVRQGNVDHAIEEVLKFLAERFDHVALFLWGKKYLNGYLGRSNLRADFGETVAKVSVEHGRIPFLVGLNKKTVFTGPPPEEDSYREFLDRFLPAPPSWQLLYPLEVLGKVVALWYADREQGEASLQETRVLVALVNLIALSLKMDIEGVA